MFVWGELLGELLSASADSADTVPLLGWNGGAQLPYRLSAQSALLPSEDQTIICPVVWLQQHRGLLTANYCDISANYREPCNWR